MGQAVQRDYSGVAKTHSLIQRLEAKFKELDWKVRRSAQDRNYDWKTAEMRDLLEEVLSTIHAPIMAYPLSDVELSRWKEPGYVVFNRR